MNGGREDQMSYGGPNCEVFLFDDNDENMGVLGEQLQEVTTTTSTATTIPISLIPGNKRSRVSNDDAVQSDTTNNLLPRYVATTFTTTRTATPLATIEPIVSAGSINTSNLLQISGLSMAKAAQSLLIMDDYVLPPRGSKMIPIPSNVDISSLLTWNVVSKVDLGSLNNVMHAFTVPKSTGGSRFICNPKYLNSQKKASDAAAEGLSMAQLLRLISEHMKGRANIFILESDFTNFFPQLDIPIPLRKYFGLWVSGNAYCLNTICQGWCRSTSVAQVISWILILEGHRGIMNAINKALGERIPSYFVYHERGEVTIIAIVYDNILVVSSSEVIRDRFKDKFFNTCTSRHAKTKYVRPTQNTFVFCGIVFQFENGTLSWKIQEEVVEGWKKAVAGGNTPRQALQLFGYVCRMAYIKLSTNYAHRKALHQVATLSRLCSREEVSWGESHPLAAAAYDKLVNIVQGLDNSWTHLREVLVRHPTLLASDASGGSGGSPGMLGYVLLHRPPGHGWLVLKKGSKTRTDEYKIDYGETLALKWALEEVESLLSPESDCLITAIDNTTTSYSLLRGAAFSSEVDQLIQESLDIILRRFTGEQIGVCDVASEDNVADVLTRSLDCSTEDYRVRLAATIRRAEVSILNMQMSIRMTSRLDI